LANNTKNDVLLIPKMWTTHSNRWSLWM